jgi:surfactin synthase thioesterase subunit
MEVFLSTSSFLKNLPKLSTSIGLIPNYNESFENYVNRMAEKVDVSEKFCLLGYSFGGIMVQEIHKLKTRRKSSDSGKYKV